MALQQKQNLTLGLLFGVLTYLASSFQGVSSKWISGNYSIVEVLFIRSLIGLIIASLLIKLTHNKWYLPTYKPHLHIVRFVFMTLFLGFMVYGMGLIPLVDSTVLSFSTCFFVFMLSGYFLGEHISLYRIIGITICFTGLIIMMQPGSTTFSIGGFAVLICVFFMACNVTLTKFMTFYEDPLSLVFYVSLFGTIVFGFITPFYWTTPNLIDLGFLILFGSTSFLIQYFAGLALTYIPAIVYSPTSYTLLFWNILFGYLIWGEIPSTHTWYGTIMIVSAGLYIIFKDYQHQKKQPKAVT